MAELLVELRSPDTLTYWGRQDSSGDILENVLFGEVLVALVLTERGESHFSRLAA